MKIKIGDFEIELDEQAMRLICGVVGIIALTIITVMGK